MFEISPIYVYLYNLTGRIRNHSHVRVLVHKPGNDLHLNDTPWKLPCEEEKHSYGKGGERICGVGKGSRRTTGFGKGGERISGVGKGDKISGGRISGGRRRRCGIRKCMLFTF